MDEQYKERVTRALSLRSTEQYDGAVAELRGVLADYAGDPLATQLLGETYFLMARYAEALPYCTEAVKLRPRSPNASLTLFHCLQSLRRSESAFREMFRFVHLRKSSEYDRLMKDLAGDPLFQKLKREHEAS